MAVFVKRNLYKLSIGLFFRKIVVILIVAFQVERNRDLVVRAQFSENKVEKAVQDDTNGKTDANRAKRHPVYRYRFKRDIIQPHLV